MLRKIFFSILILSSIVLAQSTSDSNKVTQQVWLDYNPDWYFSKNFTLSGQAGVRIDQPTTWKKYLLGSKIRYAPSSLFNFLNKLQQEAVGGFTFFYTQNNDKPNQFEARPYQGYRLNWPNVKNLKVRHYLRLEERFEFIEGHNGSDFELRARYQIEATIHWTKHLVDFADGVYIPISVEFFSNLYSTKQYNNGIRFTPGVGFAEENRWKIELDVSYQFSKHEEESYFSKNTIIYRLRFYQSI